MATPPPKAGTFCRGLSLASSKATHQTDNAWRSGLGRWQCDGEWMEGGPTGGCNVTGLPRLGEGNEAEPGWAVGLLAEMSGREGRRVQGRMKTALWICKCRVWTPVGIQGTIGSTSPSALFLEPSDISSHCFFWGAQEPHFCSLRPTPIFAISQICFKLRLGTGPCPRSWGYSWERHRQPPSPEWCVQSSGEKWRQTRNKASKQVVCRTRWGAGAGPVDGVRELHLGENVPGGGGAVAGGGREGSERRPDHTGLLPFLPGEQGPRRLFKKI